MKRVLLRSLLPVLLCPVAAFSQSSAPATQSSVPAAQSSISAAQSPTPATLTVSLTEAVERVVSEEPTRLVRLRGELLANNPEAVDYASVLKLQGADNCVISVFNTPGDTTACWKADLPAMDDFETAKKTYRSLYESLRMARINRLHPGTTYRLDGTFLAASEEKASNSIEFTLTPDEKEFKKIRVQILMNYVMPEWNLSVQIYEKPGELGETAGDE
jgi:hypothetical protein